MSISRKWMYLGNEVSMANLSITESETNILAINEELKTGLNEKTKSGIIFFANLDVSIKEIDAAIKKLEELSLKRVEYIEDEI